MPFLRMSTAAAVALNQIAKVRNGASCYGVGPLPEDQMLCFAQAFGQAMSTEAAVTAISKGDFAGDDPLAALTEYVSQVFALGFSIGAHWATES